MRPPPTIGSDRTWNEPRIHGSLRSAFGPYAILHIPPASRRERISSWVRTLARRRRWEVLTIALAVALLAIGLLPGILGGLR